MKMIPIVIITENGESFNYFEGQLKVYDYEQSFLIMHYPIGELRITSTILSQVSLEGTIGIIVFESESKELRNKVLESLHKEVGRCYYNTDPQVPNIKGQGKFQIYLKDIIKKVKEVLNNVN